MTGTGGGNPSRSVEDQFRGFGSFLAAQAVSVSCPDNVKSDVLYIAMELVDCCATPAYQEVSLQFEIRCAILIPVILLRGGLGC